MPDTQTLLSFLPEVLTQLIGFLIAFWILKKYAFGPVLAAIDARRDKIRGEFDAIEKKKQSAEALEKDYRDRIEHIEQESRAKIQEAANVGLALARDIQEKARLDAEKMIVRAKSEIDQDVAKAKLTMRDELVELSGLIAEKVVHQKMDAKEHDKLVDQFLKELEKI